MVIMSDVIAIRVPKKLKDELRELNVNYSEDIREYLEKRVKSEKLKQVIKETDAFRSELRKKTGITQSSADIIREDRDHGH
jgi:arsenate reductase-like glutaredoxin family protein